MDYFGDLQDLLKKEKAEDKRQYEEIIRSSSIIERRGNGLVWYPIAIRDTEMSRGDYLTVEAERTTHQEITPLLRFGASAALFSNHDPHNDRVEGIVSFQSGNRIKITLRTDELPDWSRDGKLGIELLFDDTSYEEMQQALKQAKLLLEKITDGRLVRVLTGVAAPGIVQGDFTIPVPALNPSQQLAVKNILQAEDLAIVHGPPGTGKTTTLVQAIKALIKQGEKRILVTAPSNTAVDLLSEKIAAENITVLRIGNPARVSDKLMGLTLDYKMSGHAAIRDIKKMKKQATEYRNMAHKYKRNFGKAERDQRKALLDEARKVMKDVENTERYILDDIIDKTQVVTSTLIGANHYSIRHLQYTTVVIDEAGQAIEPACWVAILKGKKLVLAGDHHQLPPTIKSDEAGKEGLTITLLEKLAHLYPQTVCMLEEQYRMHTSIMHFSSVEFYENRLKANERVADHLLFVGDEPLLFIDTAGSGFEEKLEGRSISNPEEASFLYKHLSITLAEVAAQSVGEKNPSVAIISPYRQQVGLLQNLKEVTASVQEYKDLLTVNTIDSFQGQERDIVYISMTRSNPDNRIGFLSEIRRMNVAMTRAKKKLVIIGDSSTLSQHPFYDAFIKYAESINAYHSVWEWMDV